MTVSNPEHKGRVDNGYYELDGTHPATGNFVLMQDGAAMYGGALYYREGYAPQSALKPEPVEEPEQADLLPLGTRVRIKRALGSDLADDHIGKTGVLVERDHFGSAISTSYDYFVNRDDDPEGSKYPLPVYADEVEAFDHGPNPEPSPRYQPGDRVSVISGDTYGEEVPAGTVGTVVRDLGKGVFPVDVRLEGDDFEYPFEYDEVEPYTEPAPLAVGDRVVYTPPAEFMGEPGTRAANPGLIGELGTVTEAPRNRGVRVRWDNAGSLRNSVEFVQPAPEYREVTYKSYYDEPYRHYGIQRTRDGKVSCTSNRAPSDLARFRAEAPLDTAATRPYLFLGTGRDIQPL